MNYEKYFIPIKIVSEANVMEHWRIKSKRKQQQKFQIQMELLNHKINPPCKVILTRIAPRKLDDEDNLRTALKASKDFVADMLIPGLAPGRADGKSEIAWEFKQEKGKVREYSLKIELIQENEYVEQVGSGRI
jgi:hypothetical protein